MATSPLTAAGFRQVCAQFATGVTVVTAERNPGQAYGMTANSFTSVSLEPCLISICVDERSHLVALLKEKRRFGLSILKAEQQEVSVYFAQADQTPEGDAKLGIRYRWTASKVPLLEEALGHMECRVVGSYVAGDHTIFLGEVQSAEVLAGEPLLFFRSKYRRVGPEV